MVTSSWMPSLRPGTALPDHQKAEIRSQAGESSRFVGPIGVSPGMDFMAFGNHYVCAAVMRNIVVGQDSRTGEFSQIDYRLVQTIGMNAAGLGDYPHMVPGEKLDRPPNYGRLVQRPDDPDLPDQVQPIARSFSAVRANLHTSKYGLHD